ncbi:protein toll [Patella vulgata]|uniref:protein toll n=1 Tax=Patella vulgata TaxID=6465 RepID=UPI0021802C63|nr:protein toll [Patella vulgata]
MSAESSIKLNSTQWDTIGVCLALIFIIGLVLILLPYFLYRRKWLPIRKLVYYFQQYEDDDGKEYDAFISYKSSKNDENFVVHKLYPKLEKELGFKLCLHFRDFLPGEAIANSIIQAIENSRRTIMILTPNYVNSEWCRLEYQKAQHEMLKLKHKIVPIILEDLSGINSMDKNLKSILDTVTYIEYPSEDDNKKYDKFWKMLGLSMPKKKGEIAMGRTPSEVPLTSVPSLTLSDSLSDDVFNENVFERSVSIPIDTVSENVHFLPNDCEISLDSERKIQNRDEDVQKETDETNELVSTKLSIIPLNNFNNEPILV